MAVPGAGAAGHGPTARVAVAIPCHNDGATLPEAVQSIRREAEAVELVVVDDGSTEPRTIEAVAALERAGERVIRRSRGGLSQAVMTGFAATHAPLFMRFDSDDLLEPGALADLANALEREPAAAAAWGDMQTFGLTSFRVPAAPALDPWLATYVNCLPGSGCLYRRTAVAAAGGWRLGSGYEDWDLWLTLAELGYPGVYVPRIVFHYRRDDGGLLMSAVGSTALHYGELRRLHGDLFALRPENRARSAAPTALKLAVDAVERLPGVPRATRIQLCQLFTQLLWNGGVVRTAPMVRQALVLRLRRLARRPAARRRARNPS